MHPQTLRQYDRLGLVTPSRASGRGRRYSLRDIATLREVQRLSQDEGVNLAGIKRILELEAELERAASGRSSTCARSSTPAAASSRPTPAATSSRSTARSRSRRPTTTADRAAVVLWRPVRRPLTPAAIRTFGRPAARMCGRPVRACLDSRIVTIDLDRARRDTPGVEHVAHLNNAGRRAAPAGGDGHGRRAPAARGGDRSVRGGGRVRGASRPVYGSVARLDRRAAATRSPWCRARPSPGTWRSRRSRSSRASASSRRAPSTSATRSRSCRRASARARRSRSSRTTSTARSTWTRSSAGSTATSPSSR